MCGHDFRFADVVEGVEQLPVQIGFRHRVVVGKAYVPHTRPGQVQRHRTTQSAQPYNKYGGSRYALLAFWPYFREYDLTGKPSVVAVCHGGMHRFRL